MHFLGLIPAQRPSTPLTKAVICPEASQTAFQARSVAYTNPAPILKVWLSSQLHWFPVSMIFYFFILFIMIINKDMKIIYSDHASRVHDGDH